MLKLIAAIVIAELVERFVEAAFGCIRTEFKKKFGGIQNAITE